MGEVRGKGSVIPLEKPVKKCRRWKLQVSTGYDKRTRKYVKRSRRFEGTKTEANRALIQFIKEVETDSIPMDCDMSFDAAAASWIKKREEDVKRGIIRKGTLRKGRVSVKNLNLYLGSTKLCDIDADLICDVMHMLRAEGGCSGEPLSGTTCQGTFRTLSMIMDEAVKQGAVSFNPCKGVDSKRRPKNDTAERQALTLDEARALQCRLMEGEPNARTVGVLLALNCGLCREEFTALRWCDISFETQCIRVANANTTDEEGLVGTKTNYRQRIIPLSDAVAQRLCEWRGLQEERLSQKGIRARATTPVVSNPVGEFMHPEAFGRWWQRYRRKVGLEAYSLHQLRHTFATILCASGVDIVTAAGLMGHCDTAMLSRVYAHVIPEYARNAAGKVASVLDGSDSAEPLPFA